MKIARRGAPNINPRNSNHGASIQRSTPPPVGSTSSRATARRGFPWFFVLVVAGMANMLLLSYTADVWRTTNNNEHGNPNPNSDSAVSNSNSQTKRNLHRLPRAVIIEDLSALREPTNTQYPPLASWTSQQQQQQQHTKKSTGGVVYGLPPNAHAESAAASSVVQQGDDDSSLVSSISTTVTKTLTNVSFCLLIKDDNDILNEWIAYHYHLWNLRRLLVAVDPSSVTSPREMLQTWETEFGLHFELWEDARYLPDFFLEGRYEMVPRMIKFEDKNATKWKDTHDQSSEALQQKYLEINNHRFRQSKFLQHCSKAIQETSIVSTLLLEEQKASSAFDASSSRWMTHIDTDEYIALNPTLLLRPAAAAAAAAANQDNHQQQQQQQQQPKTPSIPTKLTSGSLLDFLERSIRVDSTAINWPCISMPRILYGSVEDDDSNSRSSGVGMAEWNKERFETLRWKYHADFGNRDLNKQPKVIMDVTGFPHFNVSRRAFSIHRPNMQLCRMQAQMDVQDGARYPFVVHHYLGSWERYQARHDPRRTRALYDQKAHLRDGKDENEWIDGWLPEFVAQHGLEKVSKVLWQYRANGGDLQQQKQDANPDTAVKLGNNVPLSEDSVSACLLIKDDNAILNEWIAYHHHVLKLRTLIVGVDPASKQSPTALLDRWRHLMDGIQVWSDADFMPDFFLQGNYDLVPNLLGNITNSSTSIYHQESSSTVDEKRVQQELIQINNHRFRQVSFLSHCIHSLRQQNKTWMIHIDSDEYVTLHPQVQTQDHWRKLPLDPTIRPSSLFRLLKEATQDFSKGLSYPCVSMPRLLYGSKEDLDDPNRFSKLPSTFDGTKFESLRWKYHASYDADVKLNGKPKAILDLSGVPPRALMLQSRIYSIHRPGLHLCQSDRKIVFEAPHRFPLTVNHYVGSWERYNHRSDARRNRAIYDSKALVDAGKDGDWIDGWVASFVQEHGLATAKLLLAEYTVEGAVVPADEDGVDEDLEEDIPDVDEVAIDRSLVNDVSPAGGDMKNILQTFDTSIRMEFSACLLVKDDNDILNEWIAYHYHVLGLRYMIVAIDAKSHTSPSALLDQWRQFGMEIEEWTDEMFMTEIYFQKAYHLQPRLVKMKKNKGKWLEGIDDPKVKREYYNTIQDHRFRQITFLASCAKQLRDKGRTWMIHIDTDEYIVINPKLREQHKFAGTIPIPSTAEASVVPRLLNDMVVKSWDTVNYPCVSLPRLLYGSVEDPGDTSVPVGYNQSRFESLRWKYHTDFEDGALNKQPKVILDVSAIPSNDKMLLEGRVFSIHRPSQSMCRTQGQMLFEDTEYFPFSVNHYLGTFERFGSRDDPRRNRKLYDQKANVRAGKDGDRWIDSWLPSFIQNHGEERVSHLLKDYRNN